ncbi:sarcosine oxidase subunit delta family protein [Aureimonas flava]|uniref:Sarcosine oxidase subunit delta family protein n=1 Tax=Aureimonas flava TaxID=2320271 RepID=A0A3A1WQK1_9HYPH|nr:sarcosine oxidase subunit delta [Aureimonas flava]RIY03670.1 sarcosine oxidase subunit delta family protein [Aureimonas flava]
MLLIHCPYCACERPEVEFAYGGQAHIARPENPSALSDDAWRDFLYIRDNPRGRHRERWRHVHGCGRFFNAIRDTVTDKFAATYEAGSAGPDEATAEDVRA